MPMNPHDLPVYSQKQRILDALNQHQVIVVESPTGSGKTTQLPIILHEAGYADNGIIGVTQPRRIAAVSVCRYIAKQLGVPVGGYAGYKMRFEDITGPDTRLKILTDGTLLQEMKGDRWLTQYSVLMIDEAHERTLNIDFILGLVKEILPHRPELKVIISSATLNPEVFRDYFTDCPIVSIDTPIYPVDIYFDPPPVEGDEDILIGKITSVVEKIVGGAEGGDVLVFCTGEKMIKDTVARLLGCKVRRELHVMPLYGRLGSEEQEKVFDPAPQGLTKIVVSTNVAETSVTIDGISAVVDTGLAKMNFYNPRTYTSALVETSISRASADQRKGRAGRTRPGVCYRLYSEKSYKERDAFTREEIYRTDLAEVVLRMAEIGIRDFEAFPFISPPDAKGIHGAVDALRLLDALDNENGLTDIGKRMTPYPLMPRQARMIVESILRYPDVLREVIIAAAFLSTNAPFLLPQGEEMEARKAHHAFRSDRYGDFASYLNLYWDFVDAPDRQKFADRYYLDKKILDEILAITAQLEEITSRNGIPIVEGGRTEDFLKACARGLMPFVCVKDGRFDYRSVGVDRIMIHPGSVLFRENPEFIVAGEIVHTSRTYARTVSPLRKEWLADIHPDLPKMLFSKPKTGKGALIGGDRSGAFGGKSSKGAEKKDTTDQIWIGGESFPLSKTPGKGNKKRAMLEWKQLHAALGRAGEDPLPDFGGLRGTLFLDRDEVLPDSKVNTIMKAAKLLDPKKDVRDFAPRSNYHIHKDDHRDALIDDLDNLLKVTRGGKKKKKSGMGFVALYGDGEGHYWFKSIRSFHGAVSASLESLEDLADHVGEELDDKASKVLGETYRRVEALLY
jgi:ATP-dependent helicase HrpA